MRQNVLAIYRIYLERATSRILSVLRLRLGVWISLSFSWMFVCHEVFGLAIPAWVLVGTGGHGILTGRQEGTKEKQKQEKRVLVKVRGAHPRAALFYLQHARPCSRHYITRPPCVEGVRPPSRRGLQY